MPSCWELGLKPRNLESLSKVALSGRCLEELWTSAFIKPDATRIFLGFTSQFRTAVTEFCSTEDVRRREHMASALRQLCYKIDGVPDLKL